MSISFDVLFIDQNMLNNINCMYVIERKFFHHFAMNREKLKKYRTDQNFFQW